MACNAGPDIIEDGLVFCLDAGNKKSYPGTGTTWTDTVGGNNGTLTNMDASNFSGDNRGVFSFDGSNESINMPADSITPPLPLSVSFWIYFNVSGSWARVFGSSSGSSTYRGFWVQKNTSNQISMSYGDNLGTNRRTKATTQSVDINKWINVVGIMRGATDMDIYVDGINYAGSYSGSGGSLDYGTGGYPSIGKILIYYGQFKVSQLCVYNRALTADEVRQNYEATVGRYT
jgi:hypothetical protein